MRCWDGLLIVLPHYIHLWSFIAFKILGFKIKIVKCQIKIQFIRSWTNLFFRFLDFFLGSTCKYIGWLCKHIGCLIERVICINALIVLIINSSSKLFKVTFGISSFSFDFPKRDLLLDFNQIDPRFCCYNGKNCQVMRPFTVFVVVWHKSMPLKIRLAECGFIMLLYCFASYFLQASCHSNPRMQHLDTGTAADRRMPYESCQSLQCSSGYGTMTNISASSVEMVEYPGGE